MVHFWDKEGAATEIEIKIYTDLNGAGGLPEEKNYLDRILTVS